MIHRRGFLSATIAAIATTGTGIGTGIPSSSPAILEERCFDIVTLSTPGQERTLVLVFDSGCALLRYAPVYRHAFSAGFALDEIWQLFPCDATLWKLLALIPHESVEWSNGHEATEGGVWWRSLLGDF